MGNLWAHDVQKKTKLFSFRLHRRCEVADNIQTRWDIETYASKINVVSQSKKKVQAQKMLESTTKFTGERYEVGMLWSKTRAKSTEQLQLSFGSALVTGAKIPKRTK